MNDPTPDTSVVVAGLSSWHPDHAIALPVLAARPTGIAHVVIETYSVLTRLPKNQRVRPGVAWRALKSVFGDDSLVLEGSAVHALVERLAEEEIAGGATYDALVGATAHQHDRVLVTLDERARRTYRAVGVETIFLEQQP